MREHLQRKKEPVVHRPEMNHENEYGLGIRMNSRANAIKMKSESSAIRMSVEREYDTRELKKSDPPPISEIVKEGKRSSATFAGLLKANNITPENSTDLIFFSAKETATLPQTKDANIVLTQSNDIKTQVIKLTHELTNRKNVERLRQSSNNVKTGKITPEQYAQNLIEVELEGEINQIKVAAETGFKYMTGNKDIPLDKDAAASLNQLAQNYSEDKSIDLSKKLKANPSKIEYYIKQGQKLKDAHDQKNSVQKDEGAGR